MIESTAAAIIFFSSDVATQLMSYTRTDTEDGSTEMNEKPRSVLSIFLDMNTDVDIDWTRATSGAVFGVVGSCYLHVVWGMLETAVETRVPVRRSRVVNTTVKVLVDQGLSAPVYIYCYYIVTNTIQKGMAVATAGVSSSMKDWTDALRSVQQKANDVIVPTMLLHWRVWPLVHSVNFYFVPLQHRVLVQNVVLIGWSGCKEPDSRVLFVSFRFVLLVRLFVRCCYLLATHSLFFFVDGSFSRCANDSVLSYLNNDSNANGNESVENTKRG